MATKRLPFSRWWLVALAGLLMGVTGTYQFLWSSIRGPLGSTVGAGETTLGTVFTLFVLTQTIAQFPGGWIRDRWGPRVPTLLAMILLSGGFLGTAMASSPFELAVFYTVGGIGAGVGYTVAINTPVKWFKERQGLTTGFITMMFGGLSFILIPAVRTGSRTNLEHTLLALGALSGIITLSAAVVLRDPTSTESTDDSPVPNPRRTTTPSGHSTYDWHDIIRTWQFWMLYVVFIVVNGVGIMVIGKAVALAEALELSSAVATGSASLVAIADAVGVFVGSSASDRFGRERTTGVVLILSGLGLTGAVMAGVWGSGVAFIAFLGLAAFSRSPTFAIFPVLNAKYYGKRHSSTNYAILYTAKIWGAVIGGTVASALIISIGWIVTFLLGAGLVILAGLASFALRPPSNSHTE